MWHPFSILVRCNMKNLATLRDQLHSSTQKRRNSEVKNEREAKFFR
jgi:hypothetical protein